MGPFQFEFWCKFKTKEDKLLKTHLYLVNKLCACVCMCAVVCVCACVLFDENRQTELTNCPREQILRVGVWIQIIVLAGSELAVFTRDWSHGGNGGRCVCPHTPSGRAEQHIGKLIMSKSGRGTNLLPHAIRKEGGGLCLSWQFGVNATALQHLQMHLRCSDNTGA